ncbi:hypothetical protein IKG07_01260 [Candidatus Saccharibacteria bacterium]|nr:hypothetical protein [Candidatus Saccharibacteria bacterium]
MKSYITILLSVFGLSFLISSYAPEVNKDILNTPVNSQEQSIELLSEKTSVPKTEVNEITETANISTPVIASTRNTGSSTSNAQSYTITKVTDDLVATPTYRDIYRTEKLVYAHNSNNLFGYLRYLGVGSTVNLTENGVTTSYRVAGIEHFTKVPYTNARGVTGENLARCDANYNNCSGVWMGSLVTLAMGHKLAMMTCDGGANTPHRLIIYLD